MMPNSEKLFQNSNVSQIGDAIKSRVSNEPIASGGGDTHNPDMLGERLAKLEGAFDGLKSSVDTVRWMMTIVAAIMLGGFGIFGSQLVRIDTKLDAIPNKITEEFRAMRADSAAQTSAIANSITAAKQQQPQVILMPAPQLDPAQKKSP